eukprot:2440447-Rhodomonas_salina.2
MRRAEDGELLAGSAASVPEKPSIPPPPGPGGPPQPPEAGLGTAAPKRTQWAQVEADSEQAAPRAPCSSWVLPRGGPTVRVTVTPAPASQ